jgi:hypothetical protein
MLSKISLTFFFIVILLIIGGSAADIPCLETIGPNCSKCLPNHYLQDGRCFISTNCPSRQYFYHGSCLNVNSLCGDYDFFTGYCKTCADPIRYRLNSNTGLCDPIIVNCNARQYKLNNVCFDVSNTCGKFDVDTGKCLDCATNLYKLNIDGTCTLIILNCPSGQYQDGLLCVSIPR